MRVDRELLFSGEGERYWNRVKSYLGPNDCIVPVADPDLVNRYAFDAPFSLIGTYNFPVLYQVKSVTGYSVTSPRDQLYLKTLPAVSIGLFSPDQVEAVAKERANVRFLTLESVEPLRITLSQPGGGVVDVTPEAGKK